VAAVASIVPGALTIVKSIATKLVQKITDTLEPSEAVPSSAPPASAQSHLSAPEPAHLPSSLAVVIPPGQPTAGVALPSVPAEEPLTQMTAPVAQHGLAPDPQVHSLRLELTPPQLGGLTLEVHHEGRQVSAFMVVDHDAAREVVAHSETQVRALLLDHGLQVTAFEVSCRDQGRGREQGPERQAQFARTDIGEKPARSADKAGLPQRKSSLGLIDLYA
jgi:flagellar hook-length control protein FliK